jgi:type IX secretion system PorP/SprF family membrane protein
MKKFTVIIGLLTSSLLAVGQDVHFSQYYAAPAYLNPALIGKRTATAVNINYRMQQVGVDMPLNVGQVTFSQPIYNSSRMVKHLGTVAASIFQESTGLNNSLVTRGGHVTAAYNVYLDALGIHTLSLGVQGGLIQRSINVNHFRWGTQYDPFFGYNSSFTPSYTGSQNQRVNASFNAGMVWYYNPASSRFSVGKKFKAFAGLGVMNINQPDLSLINEQPQVEPIMFQFHAGGEFSLNESFALLPSLLVKQQATLYSVNVGSYAGYTITSGSKLKNNSLQLLAGMWYRVQDSFIFSAGVGTGQYVMGISYDLNSRNFNYNTQGQPALEFSLSVNIGKPKSQPRKFSTPLI